MNTQEVKGMEISDNCSITKTLTGWRVPSQNGRGNYLVKMKGLEKICNCPDFTMRGCEVGNDYSKYWLFVRAVIVERSIFKGLCHLNI